MSIKYTKEVLEKAVIGAKTMSDVMSALGIVKYSGSLHNHLKQRISEFGIDNSHMCRGRDWQKRMPSTVRKRPETILVKRPPGRRTTTRQLRRALLEVGVLHECVECSQGPVWRGKKLVLHIDHCDGDSNNNLRENLRFLCPNCHTQTETYGTVFSSRC